MRLRVEKVHLACHRESTAHPKVLLLGTERQQRSFFPRRHHHLPRVVYSFSLFFDKRGADAVPKYDDMADNNDG